MLTSVFSGFITEVDCLCTFFARPARMRSPSESVDSSLNDWCGLLLSELSKGGMCFDMDMLDNSDSMMVDKSPLRAILRSSSSRGDSFPVPCMSDSVTLS